MIRRLRDRHRMVTTGLAVALPLGFVAALRARAERPPLAAQAPAPVEANDGAPTISATVGAATALCRMRTGATGGDSLRLTFSQDPALPDLLLYWRPASAGSGSENGLTGAEVFLESLGGPGPFEMELPNTINATGGELVFYSLAHAETAGTLPLAALSR